MFSLLYQTYGQAILCTDGTISFVIFLYENPELLQLLPYLGFYAGDMARKLVISELQAKNIFRIDGKQVDLILSSGL